MKFAKSSKQRTFLGVLGGISTVTGIDYTWLRVLFVFSILFFRGWAILAYFVLAILMPASTRQTKVLSSQIGFYTKSMLRDIRGISLTKRYGRVYGFVVIGIGLLWLQRTTSFWPVVLIVLGVILLFNPFGLAKVENPLTFQYKTPYLKANYSSPTYKNDFEKQYWPESDIRPN